MIKVGKLILYTAEETSDHVHGLRGTLTRELSELRLSRVRQRLKPTIDSETFDKDCRVQMRRFGRSIKAVRVKCNMSQVQLSKKAKLSVSTISKAENGECLTFATIRKVCKACKCDKKTIELVD